MDLKIFKTKAREKAYYQGLKIITDFAERMTDPDIFVSVECDEQIKISFYIKIILDTHYFDGMDRGSKKRLKKLGFKFAQDNYCDKITFDLMK